MAGLDKFEADVLEATTRAIDKLREAMKTRRAFKDEESFRRMIVEHGVKILEDILSGQIVIQVGEGGGASMPNPLGLGTK